MRPDKVCFSHQSQCVSYMHTYTEVHRVVCLIPDVCASVGLSPLWNNTKSNGHACVFVSATSSLEPVTEQNAPWCSLTRLVRVWEPLCRALRLPAHVFLLTVIGVFRVWQTYSHSRFIKPQTCKRVGRDPRGPLQSN